MYTARSGARKKSCLRKTRRGERCCGAAGGGVGRVEPAQPGSFCCAFGVDVYCSVEYKMADELLITLVEGRPVLWDKTLEIYKDKRLTYEAWREIFIILNKDFDEMTNVKKNEYGKYLKHITIFLQFSKIQIIRYILYSYILL